MSSHRDPAPTIGRSTTGLLVTLCAGMFLVLLDVSLAAGVAAVIESGRSGLRSLPVLLFVTAAMALGAFLLVERRAAAPLLPADVFGVRRFTGAVAGSLTMNMICNGMLFVTTLSLQVVHRLTPLQAGLTMLPMFVPLAVLPPLVGRWIGRRGPLPAIVSGFAVAAPALGALTLLSSDRPCSPPPS